MHPGDSNPGDYGMPDDHHTLYQIREANTEMESTMRDPKRAEFVQSPAKKAYYPDEEVERLDQSVSDRSRSKSRQGAKFNPNREPVEYYQSTDKIASDIRIPTIEQNVGSFYQQHSNVVEECSPEGPSSPSKQKLSSMN